MFKQYKQKHLFLIIQRNDGVYKVQVTHFQGFVESRH